MSLFFPTLNISPRVALNSYTFVSPYFDGSVFVDGSIENWSLKDQHHPYLMSLRISNDPLVKGSTQNWLGKSRRRGIEARSPGLSVLRWCYCMVRWHKRHSWSNLRSPGPLIPTITDPNNCTMTQLASPNLWLVNCTENLKEVSRITRIAIHVWSLAECFHDVGNDDQIDGIMEYLARPGSWWWCDGDVIIYEYLCFAEQAWTDHENILC